MQMAICQKMGGLECTSGKFSCSSQKGPYCVWEDKPKNAVPEGSFCTCESQLMVANGLTLERRGKQMGVTGRSRALHSEYSHLRNTLLVFSYSKKNVL